MSSNAGKSTTSGRAWKQVISEKDRLLCMEKIAANPKKKLRVKGVNYIGDDFKYK